jgi:hypothetical protein
MFNDKTKLFSKIKTKLKKEIERFYPRKAKYFLFSISSSIFLVAALISKNTLSHFLLSFSAIFIMINFFIIITKKEEKEKIKHFFEQDNQDDVINNVWDSMKEEFKNNFLKYNNSELNPEFYLFQHYFYICIVVEVFNIKANEQKNDLEKKINNVLNKPLFDTSIYYEDIQNHNSFFEFKELVNLAILTDNEILFSLLLKIKSDYFQEEFDHDSLEKMISELSQNKKLNIQNSKILSSLPSYVKEHIKPLIQNNELNTVIDKLSINSNQNELNNKETSEIEEKPIIVTPDLEEFFNDKTQFAAKIENLNQIVKQHPTFFNSYGTELDTIFKELTFFTKHINLEVFHETLFISTEINNLVKKTLPNLLTSFVKIMKIEQEGKHVKDFQENIILVNRYLQDCHEFLISILQQDFKQNSQIVLSKFGEFNMQDMVKNNEQLSVQKGATLYAQQ